MLSDLPLVFLIKEDNPETVMNWLYDVQKYAHAIGPKSQLVMHKPLVQLAQDLKLDIHPWYVRDDILDHTDDPIKENLLYFDLKMNGIFTEFPHLTVSVFNEQVKKSKSNK